MNFDANRLARLAGLPAAESRTLTEASNRSMHDDAAPVSDEAEHRFGKGQLAEKAGVDDVDEAHCSSGPAKEAAHASGDVVDEMDYTEEGVHKSMEEAEHGGGGRGRARSRVKDLAESSDEYVNIDEEMLAEEIEKIRQERLDEAQLRSVIREEIASIVKGLKNSTDEEERNTSFDGITKGFPGPGFR